MRALVGRALSSVARAVVSLAPTAWPPHGAAMFHPAGDGGRSRFSETSTVGKCGHGFNNGQFVGTANRGRWSVTVGESVRGWFLRDAGKPEHAFERRWFALPVRGHAFASGGGDDVSYGPSDDDRIV